jgi:hypothetical protein
VTAYEIYQQVMGGTVLAALGYTVFEALLRASRWM